MEKVSEKSPLLANRSDVRNSYTRTDDAQEISRDSEEDDDLDFHTAVYNICHVQIDVCEQSTSSLTDVSSNVVGHTDVTGDGGTPTERFSKLFRCFFLLLLCIVLTGKFIKLKQDMVLIGNLLWVGMLACPYIKDLQRTTFVYERCVVYHYIHL